MCVCVRVTIFGSQIQSAPWKGWWWVSAFDPQPHGSRNQIIGLLSLTCNRIGLPRLGPPSPIRSSALRKPFRVNNNINYNENATLATRAWLPVGWPSHPPRKVPFPSRIVPGTLFCLRRRRFVRHRKTTNAKKKTQPSRSGHQRVAYWVN